MERANYLAVGTFVLLALALLVGGVIAFSAGGIFRPARLMETYIDNSVQGLEVGSAVKNRGVPIGKVKAIGFAGDTYHIRADKPEAWRAQRYVRVVLAIDKNKGVDIGTPELLHQAVASGLRIRVAAQGITGVMFLQMDYIDPAHAPQLPVFWKPVYPVIPSAPSVFSELSDAAQNVFKRLARVDMEGAVNEFERTLATVRAVVEQADVSNVVAEVRETNRRMQALIAGADMARAVSNAAAASADLRQVAAVAARDLPDLSARASRAIDAAATLLGQLSGLATGSVSQTTGSLAASSRALQQTLQAEVADFAEMLANLRQASQRLNDFAGSIRDAPSRLLRRSAAAPDPLEDRSKP